MYYEDECIEPCARAAHEANRAYCIAIGDNTQLPWEEAGEELRDSARQGVRGALKGNTPEQSHEGWMAHRLAHGWVWGPVKDPDKKEHPCLVPYADLPRPQRVKDDLYLSVVRSMADAVVAFMEEP